MPENENDSEKNKVEESKKAQDGREQKPKRDGEINAVDEKNVAKAPGDVEKGNKVDNKEGGERDPKKPAKNEAKKDGDDKKEESKNKTLADEMKEAVHQQKEESKSDGEELAFFERQGSEEHYSIWNLDCWLQATLKHTNVVVRLLIEVMLVSIIFIGPSALWLYKEWRSIDSAKFMAFFQQPGPLSYDPESVFRLGLFVVIWYTADCIVNLICESIITLMSVILASLQLDESEFIWNLVDNFYSARQYFRLCIIFLFVFELSNYMFDEYKGPSPGNYNVFDPMFTRALVLWYGIYAGMMFVMKFLVNIFIYDIKRSSYSETILDLNNKIFILKKLKAISEAWGMEYHDLCDNMMPSYDPGFYLKDRDFFASKEDAEVVAQNIMALFKKKALTYSDIREYFPSNHEKVFKYLSNTDTIQEKQSITVSALKTLSKDLYLKRVDMNRTLKDRNYIFEKLEFIFSLLVKYISIIVLCIIFHIADYKVYFASFGTSILTFSWVFADSIKKLFNCFVFVLIIRPYDIGDRVKINDENYTVNKIDLLTTTFLTNLKKLTYIPNDVLIATKIYNIARSPAQSLIIEITVDEHTTYEQGRGLVDIVKGDIKKAKKHFIELEFQKIVDSKLYYIIYTTQNFQNFDVTVSRQNKLIKIFENGLIKANIAYKNSFSFID